MLLCAVLCVALQLQLPCSTLQLQYLALQLHCLALQYRSAAVLPCSSLSCSCFALQYIAAALPCLAVALRCIAAGAFLAVPCCSCIALLLPCSALRHLHCLAVHWSWITVPCSCIALPCSCLTVHCGWCILFLPPLSSASTIHHTDHPHQVNQKTHHTRSEKLSHFSWWKLWCVCRWFRWLRLSWWTHKSTWTIQSPPLTPVHHICGESNKFNFMQFSWISNTRINVIFPLLVHHKKSGSRTPKSSKPAQRAPGLPVLNMTLYSETQKINCILFFSRECWTFPSHTFASFVPRGLPKSFTRADPES